VAPIVAAELFDLEEPAVRKKTYDKAGSFKRDYGVSVVEQEEEPINLVDTAMSIKDPNYFSRPIDEVQIFGNADLSTSAL